MEGLIVILLYAFKLAFLALLACVKTKVFSLKSEVKKAYLHAHKRILIILSIIKEVYAHAITSLCRYVVSVSKALHMCYCAQARGYEVCDITDISANALRHYFEHCN